MQACKKWDFNSGQLHCWFHYSSCSFSMNQHRFLCCLTASTYTVLTVTNLNCSSRVRRLTIRHENHTRGERTSADSYHSACSWHIHSQIHIHADLHTRHTIKRMQVVYKEWKGCKRTSLFSTFVIAIAKTVLTGHSAEFPWGRPWSHQAFLCSRRLEENLQSEGKLHAWIYDML